MNGKRLLFGSVVVLFAVILVVLLVSNIVPSCANQIAAYQQMSSRPGKIIPPKFLALSMCSDEIQAKY